MTRFRITVEPAQARITVGPAQAPSDLWLWKWEYAEHAYPPIPSEQGSAASKALAYSAALVSAKKWNDRQKRRADERMVTEVEL